jgi:hypothetical protein
MGKHDNFRIKDLVEEDDSGLIKRDGTLNMAFEAWLTISNWEE